MLVGAAAAFHAVENVGQLLGQGFISAISIIIRFLHLYDKNKYRSVQELRRISFAFLGTFE